MNNNKKLESKRLSSTKEYIDELSKEYSKLNIVRVDLGYKKPHSNNVTLDEANKDFNRMLNNRRSKPSIFEDNVGYVCKKEYTEDKGVHLHALFIFNGQKVHKDKLKGKSIGEYWNDKITKNKGSYHNCNMNDYKDNGVGILDHRDSEKRKQLDEKVITYLCKDEQNVDPISRNKKDKSFTRGTIPKNKSKIGRPRKKLE